ARTPLTSHYSLTLHDALPILDRARPHGATSATTSAPQPSAPHAQPRAARARTNTGCEEETTWAASMPSTNIPRNWGWARARRPQIGRAHGWTPVTDQPPIPPS